MIAAQRRPAASDVGATRYVRSGQGHIAYQVLGSGGRDVLVINESVLPIEALQDNVDTVRYLDRLCALGRVILFDRRGVGLSDPVSANAALSLADWVADAVAVLDAVDSDRAAVFASGPSAGLIALQLAHRCPDRVSLLGLYDAIARYRWAPDYPWGVTAEVEADIDARLQCDWGTARLADRRGRFAATAADSPQFAEWALTWFRRGASPSTMVAQNDAVRTGDVRHMLPALACPTLIINHSDVEDGRYLAAHIPNSTYIELENPRHMLFSAEIDVVMASLTELMTGSPIEPATHRVLATVLFTDIVDSTKSVVAVGDRRWGIELDHHYDTVRRQLEIYDGHEIKTVGDGFIAIFDGPTRAVQCALAIRHEVTRRGVTIRAGLHTGEVELRRNDVLGLTVHIAQRICGFATPDQVLVSQRVVDLVAGSTLQFAHIGDHLFKGLEGQWSIFDASQP